EKDRTTLHDSLAAIHEGRGNGALYGLLQDRTLFVQSDVSDEGKLRQGVQKAVRALELPALKAPLGQVLGDFTVQSSEQAVGELKAQRFVLRPRKAGQPSFEALFATRGAHATFVLGAAAAPVLERLLAAPVPSSTLAADATVSAVVAPLGKEVGFALFMDAAALGFADPKAGSAPALIALGRDGRMAKLSFSCSARALATLAEHLVARGREGQ
ncbi:MAG TPA: hypothetical protein VM686_25015, partial [Polyangiaceae bacterium]|nr:hypothetical protein [Polyangiaceae bacterium]